ncbi:hypothetical protein [Clostridium massiliamazoniense]|uniref:hypothetical protein n=1 Tax=Clostridium massiliamazoniense TaxID=1347366 RepID=UPI000AAFDABA|nr:hypothetical protein [Clostridium massiliamazoniense]
MDNEMHLAEEKLTKNTIVREEGLKRKARVNQLRMKTKIRRRKLGAINKGSKR